MTNITQTDLDHAYQNFDNACEFPDDVQRIRKIAEGAGISLTPVQARRIWEWHSEEFYFAGWLRLGGDDEIIRVLERFVGVWKWRYAG